jgi:hypothetical protein
MPRTIRVGEQVVIECADALEFVSVLDPLNGPYLQPPTTPVFVFRGVSSAAHQLIPSAFRSSKYLLRYSNWTSAPFATIGDQCAAELETLRRFFDVAAQNGIRLPEDSQFLRARLDRWRDVFLGSIVATGEKWPPPEFLSLIALAQHYGVPTRALDWSSNPLVAAYFAARSADPASDDTIVVWLFLYLAKILDSVMRPAESADRSLLLFTAPGADNENLRAQRGLFMLQTHPYETFNLMFAPASYDALVADAVGVHDVPLVHRVSVSARYAVDVLAHLSLAGVTAASLFPGLWGVARDLDDQRLIATCMKKIKQTEFSASVRADLKRVSDPGA